MSLKTSVQFRSSKISVYMPFLTLVNISLFTENGINTEKKQDLRRLYMISVIAVCFTVCIIAFGIAIAIHVRRNNEKTSKTLIER